MSLLNLSASYFAIDNPLRSLERCFHPMRYRASVQIYRREVELCWTSRAEAELRRSEAVLIVELQLYFSCVVKKRVLFHRQPVDYETVRVNDRLEIAFRPVASAVCDPREFAASYPQARELVADQAARMVPRLVKIDHSRGSWQGQFAY